MSALFEGDFVGKPVKAEFGPDSKNRLKVRVMMEIAEGPRAGTQVPYEGNFKPEAIAWTKRDLLALGWQGKTTATLVEDIMRNPKVVPFQTRIAETTYEDTGKVRQWTSVRSIGYAAPPLKQAEPDHIRDADAWFAEVGDHQSQSQPTRGNSDGNHPNAPGAGRVPF